MPILSPKLDPKYFNLTCQYANELWKWFFQKFIPQGKFQYVVKKSYFIT